MEILMLFKGLVKVRREAKKLQLGILRHKTSKMQLGFWAWDLSVSMPKDTLLETINFSFVNSYHLEIVSGLGMGICVQLPSQQ